jgi:D-erythronate 2-dehydrogenase
MRILITGAAGFIGRRLTAALLARGTRNAAGAARPGDELVLADLAACDAGGDPRVRVETGDFADPAFVARLLADGVDSVFHLAAALTIEAEARFDHGLAVNLHGLLRLLDACRRQRRPPRFVFASSIAAFGGPLPATVDDAVARTPQTSYGTHKAIAELLIDDYTRHGFVDGRALRLPIVLVRPGAASPAVSDRVAAIVREPLAGRDVVCPLAADTRIPVASARRVAAALLELHDLPAQAFGATRTMNLPSLTVEIGEMVESLHRFAGGRTVGRVRWEPDARLQELVEGWPRQLVSECASRAGIRGDASFDEIVAAYVEDEARQASAA